MRAGESPRCPALRSARRTAAAVAVVGVMALVAPPSAWATGSVQVVGGPGAYTAEYRGDSGTDYVVISAEWETLPSDPQEPRSDCDPDYDDDCKQYIVFALCSEYDECAPLEIPTIHPGAGCFYPESGTPREMAEGGVWCAAPGRSTSVIEDVSVFGEAGNDFMTIVGSLVLPSEDTGGEFESEPGVDVGFVAGPGDDVVPEDAEGGELRAEGGPGDDRFETGTVLIGGPDHDSLTGGILMDGGLGNDTLTDGGRVDGGPGNDTLTEGNRMDGGPGSDRLTSRSSRSRLGIGAPDSASDGADTISIADDRRPGVAMRINGGYGDDRITGSRAPEQIHGQSGRDIIASGAGRDRAYGDGGNDRVSGDAGNDKVDGGLGVDNLFGGAGADFLKSRDGRYIDRVDGGVGKDSAETDRRDIVKAVESRR